MGSDTSSYEMGNMATIKANGADVVVDAEPNSAAQSMSDYVDNDQLARLGKKQVLKVRHQAIINIQLVLLSFRC